jgi:hypothetical protein
LQQKKEKLEAKVRVFLEEHEIADKVGERSCPEACRSEQEKVHEQSKRLEKQAARIAAFWAANAPKRGKRGKELQSHVTDNDSAQMQPAHGVIQGDNGQAWVGAHSQVIVHAEALGNGQDYGHVGPMVEGATANLQAIGLPEKYLAGQILSADSNDHSEGNLQQCAEAKRDAYIPAPHVRRRDPCFATQARHKLPPEAKFTLAEVAYDHEQDCSICPQGKVLKLATRRHKIGNKISRR